MELTQLIHFQKAAQYGNLTKAAQELYVSESALSKSIRKLENELGLPLFDRTKNRLSLNENGEKILPYVKEALARIDKIKDVCEDRRMAESTVRIAFSDSSVMRMILSQIMDACAGYNFSELFLKEERVEAALLDGTCDMALTFVRPASRKLIWIPVYEDIPMVIAPPSHPFFMKKSIALKDLHHQDVLMMKDSGYLTELINQLFEQQRIRPYAHYQMDQALCYQKMKTTKYLTFISTVNLPNVDIGASHAIPILENGLSVTCYLSYRRKQAKKLLPVIREIEKYYHLLKE